MSAHPDTGGAEQDAGAPDGVWLTDRDPGELLGTRRVIVAVTGSDPVVVAEVPTKAEAVAVAEQTLELVERAAARGDWAELGDRLVRPDAIESVDVELVE
jgi:hypothetical protein